jgi:hypothetical protein
MVVFWVVAPCSLVDVYQRFRGPCAPIMEQQGPETLVNVYQTTRRYNTEDSHLRKWSTIEAPPFFFVILMVWDSGPYIAVIVVYDEGHYANIITA